MKGAEWVLSNKNLYKDFEYFLRELGEIKEGEGQTDTPMPAEPLESEDR